MMSGTKLIHDAALQDLSRLGFRFSKHMFRSDLAPRVEGRLGLNTGNTAPGTVVVNPFVAVRHTDIEREIADRQGLSSADHPSISAHLGEVGVYDVPLLIVSDEESAAEVAAFIVDRLERFGLPWMREMTTLEGLAHGLDRYRGSEPFFRQPLAYRNLGRPDLALEVLDRDIGRFEESRDTGTADRYRQFAAVLRPELVALIQAATT